MNKVITLILALYAVLFLSGQNFEGEITYKNSFKSKIPNVTDRQLASMVGSTQHYFIKGGNYRSDANGAAVLWQIYINSDNKLYNKIAGSETIYWNDGAINQDEVLKAEVKQNAVEI